MNAGSLIYVPRDGYHRGYRDGYTDNRSTREPEWSGSRHTDGSGSDKCSTQYECMNAGSLIYVPRDGYHRGYRDGYTDNRSTKQPEWSGSSLEMRTVTVFLKTRKNGIIF